MTNLSNISNKESRNKKRAYSIDNIRDKLDIIKESILKCVSAKKIYLFGSYAYGKPNKKSDIDIYAVIPDDFEKNIIKTMGEIASHLRQYDILNIDLFLVKENKFLFYTENSSFEETIYNEGIILYENT